jgi:hypothetical protein
VINQEVTMVHTPNSPTVTLVPDDERMDFLPRLFPGCFSRGEALVYGVTRKWFPAYNGGQWDFFLIDGRPGFMAPAGEGGLDAMIPGNQFEGHLSHRAVGVVVTLVALAASLEQVPSETLLGHYERLRALIPQLPERDLIYRAID